jgi:hypothetical protein
MHGKSLCTARQRPHDNAKPDNAFFAVRRQNCTATTFVVLSPLCRALPDLCRATPLCRVSRGSAVQDCFAMRPHRCHARFLCRASPSLSCTRLCRPPVSTLCRAPATNTHGKELVRHTTTPPGSTGYRQMASLPCAYTRQRARNNFYFFYFYFIPCILKLEIHIYAYI